MTRGCGAWSIDCSYRSAATFTSKRSIIGIEEEIVRILLERAFLDVATIFLKNKLIQNQNETKTRNYLIRTKSWQSISPKKVQNTVTITNLEYIEVVNQASRGASPALREGFGGVWPSHYVIASFDHWIELNLMMKRNGYEPERDRNEPNFLKNTKFYYHQNNEKQNVLA